MSIRIISTLLTQGQVIVGDAISYITTSGGSQLTDQRLADWNSQAIVNHEFTVTWTDAQALADYFSAGGQIRMYGERLGGTSNLQNTSRTELLNQIGTVTFAVGGISQTGANGAPTALTLGTLTSSYQFAFNATSTATSYTTDLYSLEMKQVSSNTITFSIQHTDANDGIVDEFTDGTLFSYVDSRRNVSSPDPIFATNVSMEPLGGPQ